VIDDESSNADKDPVVSEEALYESEQEPERTCSRTNHHDIINRTAARSLSNAHSPFTKLRPAS
jgi:hypothetical protein